MMARLPDVPVWFFQLQAREYNRLQTLFLNIARLVDSSVYESQKNDTILYIIQLLLPNRHFF